MVCSPHLLAHYLHDLSTAELLITFHCSPTPIDAALGFRFNKVLLRHGFSRRSCGVSPFGKGSVKNFTARFPASSERLYPQLDPFLSLQGNWEAFSMSITTAFEGMRSPPTGVGIFRRSVLSFFSRDYRVGRLFSLRCLLRVPRCHNRFLALTLYNFVLFLS